jgi:acetyltransferase-like isoleucine patch superfamily enzyme
VIGNFNVFGRMELVRLEEGARINTFNLFVPGITMEPAVDRGVTRSLIMGPHSRIIFMHVIDVSGGVILGEEAWLTGMRSTILSHVFDPEGGIIIEPIELKRRAVVGTNCTLLAGAVVGEGALVGAGSTLWTRQEVAADNLAGGVPARRLAKISITEEAYNSLRQPAPAPAPETEA